MLVITFDIKLLFIFNYGVGRVALHVFLGDEDLSPTSFGSDDLGRVSPSGDNSIDYLLSSGEDYGSDDYRGSGGLPTSNQQKAIAAGITSTWVR